MHSTRGLGEREKDVIMILESDALCDICRIDNPTLKLFLEDIRVGVLNVFDMPLSELKNYQETAN